MLTEELINSALNFGQVQPSKITNLHAITVEM